MIGPTWAEKAFRCPHCNAFAEQRWAKLYANAEEPNNLTATHAATSVMEEAWAGNLSHDLDPGGSHLRIKQIHLTRCAVCSKTAIWLGARLLWPATTAAPTPSIDMPIAVLRDYNEASVVLPVSPRAAAALLRLATEKLCGHLLEKQGRPINEMIGEFVKLGIPSQVQKAMDVLRITGNEAVHPGTMVSVDDEQTALNLFGLVNLIVEVMITQPKHIDQLFDSLPEGKRQGIAQRDKPPKSTP